MTETQDKEWDLAQNAVVDAIAEASALLATVPDTMRHTPSRNLIVAAMVHGENFRDALAAARARIPKEGE